MNRTTVVLAVALMTGAAFAQPEPPPAQPAPPAPPTPPRAARASRVFVQTAPAASFLGVGVTDIDGERAKALRLKEEHGAEVTSVDADSPAAKAGVKVGDVVLEYNGQRVEGSEQLVRFVRETPVGRQVKLLISRNGATQTAMATTASKLANTFVWNSEDFKFKMPAMPDMPHALMMWQSRTLGVESESLNSQLAEYFGAKEGVLVRSVIKGSAAEKAGIKAGDVITRIGSQKVSSPNEISRALHSLSSTKAIPVTIVRDRKEMTVNVTIEEKSSEERTSSAWIYNAAARAAGLSRLDSTIPWTLTRSSTSFCGMASASAMSREASPRRCICRAWLRLFKFRPERVGGGGTSILEICDSSCQRSSRLSILACHSVCCAASFFWQRASDAARSRFSETNKKRHSASPTAVIA